MDLFPGVTFTVPLRPLPGTTGVEASFDPVPYLAAAGHHKLPKDVLFFSGTSCTVTYANGRVTLTFPSPVSGGSVQLIALMEY